MAMTMLLESSIYSHVIRSYIEEEFTDGPQNGVFARDPDLREFVVRAHAIHCNHMNAE